MPILLQCCAQMLAEEAWQSHLAVICSLACLRACHDQVAITPVQPCLKAVRRASSPISISCWLCSSSTRHTLMHASDLRHARCQRQKPFQGWS